MRRHEDLTSQHPLQGEDGRFWADMPNHRWSLEWVGWPKTKPRHSVHGEGWQLQVVLSILMCTALALCLMVIH